MSDKQDVSEEEDIEIGNAEDAVDRIEEYWFNKLGISNSDYVYVKRVGNHLVVGKAEITFVE